MEYRAKNRPIRNFFSMPLIWSGIIILPILDLWFEIFHRICFKLYDMPYVKRSDYIRIDRHKLKKFRFNEKIGCIYCGYVNGWIGFSSEIAARTEKYWCSIVHKDGGNFKPPEHHKNFDNRDTYE